MQSMLHGNLMTLVFRTKELGK